MSTSEAPAAVDLRDELKRRIDQLTADRLPMAKRYLDFLEYLEEIRREEELEEMDNPPYSKKFIEGMERAQADIAAGRTTPVCELKRKY